MTQKVQQLDAEELEDFIHTLWHNLASSAGIRGTIRLIYQPRIDGMEPKFKVLVREGTKPFTTRYEGDRLDIACEEYNRGI